MVLLSLQNLNYNFSTSFVNQTRESLFNETTKKVGYIALAIFAIAMIAWVIRRSISPSPKFVLKRDSDGKYTLPHFEVPGFKNEGTMRAVEHKIYVGNFIIDTEKGILPPGWVLEK